MRVPYVYKITFDTGHFYVGSRYKKSCHPDDLCVTYWTSSKNVRRRLERGDKFTKEILLVFPSDARGSEVLVEEYTIIKDVFSNPLNMNGVLLRNPGNYEKIDFSKRSSLTAQSLGPAGCRSRSLRAASSMTDEQKSARGRKIWETVGPERTAAHMLKMTEASRLRTKDQMRDASLRGHASRPADDAKRAASLAHETKDRLRREGAPKVIYTTDLGVFTYDKDMCEAHGLQLRARGQLVKRCKDPDSTTRIRLSDEFQYYKSKPTWKDWGFGFYDCSNLSEESYETLLSSLKYHR